MHLGPPASPQLCSICRGSTKHPWQEAAGVPQAWRHLRRIRLQPLKKASATRRRSQALAASNARKRRSQDRPSGGRSGRARRPVARFRGRFNARCRSHRYCQADRYCRIPCSGFAADARACSLHDGQSHIPRRRLTRRDGPRSVLPLRRPPHPSSSRPRVTVKSSRPLSTPRLKPQASRSVSS